MPCLIALLVLSVLSVFSASHRKLTKEAFECVFRRVRLKACDTGFDVKVKAKVLGSLINRSPRLARVVAKHFELLSWLLVIGLTVSSLYAVRGLYNYYAWGSCGGLNSSSFCVFDPTGKNNQTSTIQSECSLEETRAQDLTLDSIELTAYPFVGQGEAELVMIGCYSCPYTRETFPRIDSIMRERNKAYQFVHFPVHEQSQYITNYDYCVRSKYPDLYGGFVKAVMGLSSNEVADEQRLITLLTGMGMNIEELATCVEMDTTKASASAELRAIEDTGIFGTPTVFVDGKAVVGPKPDRVYQRLLRRSWL